MLDGSHSTGEVLVPKINFEDQVIEPGHHLEVSTRNTLVQLGMAYGITSRWSVFGVLPLLVGKAHEHYDALLTLYYVKHQFPSSLEWFVSGSQRFNGRNALEYQVGNETVLSGGVGYANGERWVYSLQLNARHAGRDDYRGQGVPSTGSDSVSLSPGIRFSPGKQLELYAHLQIPVAQDVNEAQLAPRLGFIVGLSKRF